MPIHPSGIFKSEKDFGDLLVSSQGGRLIYLKDIATIHRDYVDPPRNILRVKGQPALGMIPLLQDDFFFAMAVTIMFDLGFATVLTLVFVPVLYATLFKIPYKDKEAAI